MHHTAREYWLTQCRRHMNSPRFKVAELGGDGQDAPFEQSFSNLAHAFLRDKAPSLLDHEQGFQLLDRNEDNTKAVGVFAFKVGSQQLYAPVFFLRGDLKGHELLYMKSQDMFIPLKENWLNYILNRKPNILGTGVSRQTSQLGVRQPDLNGLSQSPYKYAACREFLPLYGHLSSASLTEAVADFASHCQDRLDLAHFLKQASMPALEAVVELFQQRPKIASAFDQWHGLATLSDAIKEARVRMDMHSVLDDPYKTVNRNQNQVYSGSVLDFMSKEAADDDNGPDVKQKVKIIVFDQSMVTEPPEGLDESDAEKLLQDGVLIEDTRTGDEVSVAVQLQVEQKLTNPGETGVYKVLTKPGDYEKCLVIVNPAGPDGRKPGICTVVRLDSGSRNWGNFPTSEVWVAGQEDELAGEESWKDWFDSQSSVSLSEGDTRYVIIGPRRNATLPFKVKKSIGEDSWEVSFDTYCRGGRRTAGLYEYPGSYADDFDRYDKYTDGQRIHLDAKKGTDLRSNMGDVYIPQGYKILKAKPSEQDSERSRSSDSCCEIGGGSDLHSSPPPIQPGRLLDATMQLMYKTSELRVLHDGIRYHINDEAMDKTAALVHLIEDHGLREEQSRVILKEASAAWKLRRAYTCRVKYANPYLTEQGPYAPAIPDQEMGGYNPMGFAGNTIVGQGQELPVQDMSARNTDPQVYNVNPANMEEPMDSNVIMQAAATGQKEVFDTAMIGSMLKAVRDDTMIDRYLPDLVKGMDRLGRILFMFYWHQDKFAERYGKQDLPELEDSLRNAFEMCGDTILFLKQKTIEPYPEEDTRDLNLDDVANV